MAPDARLTVMDFQLEKYKAFPYVAWTLFIGFAVFVGHLAFELYTVTEVLEEANVEINEIVNDNSNRLDAVEEQLDALAQ
jgi:hypothetical protein